MGSNSTFKPRHAEVWTIIREDETARSQNGHVPTHMATDLMTGYKPMAANR